MNRTKELRRQQKSVVLVALILFALVLFVLQLWLFVTTLEEALAGHVRLSWATAVASIALVAVDCWMLDGIYRLDRGP
jgi:hypothetical protein